MRALTLTIVLLVTSAGCKSSEAAICDRLKECAYPELDVDDCKENAESLVETDLVTDEALDSCADCLDEKSCSEIGANECGVRCAALDMMI